MSHAALSPVKFSQVVARLAQAVVTFSILGTALFLGAGRLDWPGAWILLAAYFIIAAAATVWTLLRDPDLSVERSRIGKNVKSWDKVLVSLNLLLTLAQWTVIGLDAGRFGWSFVPLPIRVAAGVLLLSTFGLTSWASIANTFLSAQVRIQTERNHHAVTTGPYRFVRHPMYVAMILSGLSLPLVFGSLWALGVSACMWVVLIIRTTLEDRTLQTELPGYADYARQVHYRLIPGLW